MDGIRNKKPREQRIQDYFKARLEMFFPDIEDWSLLKCARFLKSEGLKIETTDIDQLREEVLEVMRDHAYESPVSKDRFITYRIWLSDRGPADWFELYWSEKSRTWVGGTYAYQDALGRATRSITQMQADQIAQFYMIDPEAG